MENVIRNTKAFNFDHVAISISTDLSSNSEGRSLSYGTAFDESRAD